MKFKKKTARSDRWHHFTVTTLNSVPVIHNSNRQWGYLPVFEKTCAISQKSVKSHVFWNLKKKHKIHILEHWCILYSNTNVTKTHNVNTICDVQRNIFCTETVWWNPLLRTVKLQTVPAELFISAMTRTVRVYDVSAINSNDIITIISTAGRGDCLWMEHLYHTATDCVHVS